MVYITAMPPGEDKRREHYAGWALLRLGLMELGRCDPAETVEDVMGLAQKGGHGKPYFPSGPQFSISHSRGLIACAIETEPVGLDIERVREFTPGMIKKICTERELMLTGGDNRLLTKLWTCKESHMKLTGLGFSQGLRETEFLTLGGSPEMAGEGEHSFCCTQLIHAGQEFWLTLCTARPEDFQLMWTDYNIL